jgi:hypothetical protein
MRRYDDLKSTSDLGDALQTMERALAALPANHSERAKYFIIGADCWRAQSKIARAPEALESAIHDPAAPPSIRVRAAVILSQYPSSDARRAYRSLKVGVELLRTLNPHNLGAGDQQANLSDLFGLTSEAASAGVEAGATPIEIVELLETGRGLMATLVLQLRSDVSNLLNTYPDHARGFLSLRDMLDSEDQKFLSSTETALHSLERRRQLANDFDTALSNIRKLEGFERFPLSPSEKEVLALANEGPLVLLNVSRTRSDTFIISLSSNTCNFRVA